MKNQKKQLIIMAILFLFLIIGYVSLNTYNENKEEQELEENTIVLTEFDSSDVVAFSYIYNEETYSFSKADDGWTYEAKPDMDMDETLIEEMLVIASTLTATDCFSDYESIQTYGLDEPQQVVTLMLTDGTAIKLSVGDYNEITQNYYFMFAGDENLYVVDSTLLDTFSVGYSDLEYVEETTETTESVESTEIAE